MSLLSLQTRKGWLQYHHGCWVKNNNLVVHKDPDHLFNLHSLYLLPFRRLDVLCLHSLHSTSAETSEARCQKVRKEGSITYYRNKHASYFREGLHIIYSKDCKIHPPPEIKQRLEDLDEIDRCQRMSSIDAIFLRLFPLAFLVFNLIYWPYWVMMPDENVEKTN